MEVPATTSARGTVGIGFELAYLRHGEDVFEQHLHAFAGLCGHAHDGGLAAPLLGEHALFGELMQHLIGICARLVYLVDGDDDGHFRLTRVVYRLYCLRHDAVVGGDHEHRDVRDLRAACTHGSERLVTRGVEEGDGRAFERHGVSADVLGYAARLAARDIGFPDIVEQRSLAVVDMTHDGDHGRTRTKFGHILVVDDQLCAQRLLESGFGLELESDGTILCDLADDELRGREIYALVDGLDDAETEQVGDDLARAYARLFAENFDGHGIRSDDRVVDIGRLPAALSAAAVALVDAHALVVLFVGRGAVLVVDDEALLDELYPARSAAVTVALRTGTALDGPSALTALAAFRGRRGRHLPRHAAADAGISALGTGRALRTRAPRRCVTALENAGGNALLGSGRGNIHSPDPAVGENLLAYGGIVCLFDDGPRFRGFLFRCGRRRRSGLRLFLFLSRFGLRLRLCDLFGSCGLFRLLLGLRRCGDRHFFFFGLGLRDLFGSGSGLRLGQCLRELRRFCRELGCLGFSLLGGFELGFADGESLPAAARQSREGVKSRPHRRQRGLELGKLPAFVCGELLDGVLCIVLFNFAHFHLNR